MNALHLADYAEWKSAITVQGRKRARLIQADEATARKLFSETRAYVRVSGHVRHMVVKNSELLCGAGKRAVFIVTEGAHARVDRLVIYDVCAENIAEMISDPGNKIVQIETSNVLINR